MRLAIAVMLAAALLACGEEHDAAPSCGFRRFTQWQGATAIVQYLDGDGAMVAWCEVPGGDPRQAACADAAGNPVLMTGACVENLPTDAPPRP